MNQKFEATLNLNNYHSMLKTFTVCLLCIFIIFTPVQAFAWGGTAHRLISDAAVDNLPAAMFDDSSGNAFNDNKAFLSTHSTWPDFIRSGGSDPNESPRHFNDLDNMFLFNGSFPFPFTTISRDYNTYISQFASVGGRSNGVIQWEGYAEHYDSLVQAFRARNWHAVYRVAADLGHYVEDSHSPFHAVANFNGQLTGNNGIHSRHESTMVNLFISAGDLTTRRSNPALGTSIQIINDQVELAFESLVQGFSLVDAILAADDAAVLIDPGYGITYYNEMFSQVGAQTITQMNDAAERLANIWYSAWVEAGSPNFDPTPVIKFAPTLSVLIDGDLSEYTGQSEVQTNITDFGDNVNELDQLFISRTTNNLLLAVAGNLTDENATTLFLDLKPGGSSSLFITNGPAYLQNLTGTVFATGFQPDFALSVQSISGNRIVHLVDLQAGTASILATSANVAFPLAGGGAMGFDNNNTGGVLDRAGRLISDADQVRTGIEISFPFANLGVTSIESTVVKVLAMITRHESPAFVSNQFLPGFPDGEFWLPHSKIDTTVADLKWAAFKFIEGDAAAKEHWEMLE